eukprot:gene29148-32368_t
MPIVVKHLQRNKTDVHRIVRFAGERDEPDLLILLLESTGGAVSLKALRYLIHALASERLNRIGRNNANSHADKIESFLVKHVTSVCNPLSVTAAILLTIEEEIIRFDETDKLGVRLDNKDTQRSTLHQMVKILRPDGSTQASYANDVSPLMPDSVSVTSSAVGYRILKNLGLAGSPLDLVILTSMRSLHAYAG